MVGSRPLAEATTPTACWTSTAQLSWRSPGALQLIPLSLASHCGCGGLTTASFQLCNATVAVAEAIIGVAGICHVVRLRDSSVNQN